MAAVGDDWAAPATPAEFPVSMGMSSKLAVHTGPGVTWGDTYLSAFCFIHDSCETEVWCRGFCLTCVHLHPVVCRGAAGLKGVALHILLLGICALLTVSATRTPTTETTKVRRSGQETNLAEGVGFLWASWIKVSTELRCRSECWVQIRGLRYRSECWVQIRIEV